MIRLPEKAAENQHLDATLFQQKVTACNESPDQVSHEHGIAYDLEAAWRIDKAIA